MAWSTNKLRRKLSRATSLSLVEWRLIGEAWLTLLWMHGVVSLLAFGRWRRLLLTHNNRASQQAPSAQQREQLAMAVGIAANHHPASLTCLHRCMALQKMFHRRGVHADLRIGVRKNGERLEGHAWLQGADEVVADLDEQTQPYTLVTLPEQVFPEIG